MIWVACAYAGAWTREAGSEYVKLGADAYLPSTYYDPLAGAITDQKYHGEQTSVYAEVGVLRTWPVQVEALLPLDWAETVFAGGAGRASTVRPGDAHLGVQVAILHRGPQLSVAVDAKIPLYSNDTVGAAFGAFQSYFPKLGDDQLDVTGWVLAGTSVPLANGWVEGGVGYRHRTEDFFGWNIAHDYGITFVDGVPFTFTAGAGSKRVLVMLKVDGLVNVRADAYTREGLALGPAVLVTVWRGLGLEGRFSDEVWVHDASRGIGFGVGVSWRQ